MRPAHILKAIAIVLSTLVAASLVIVTSVLDRDAKISYAFVRFWVWANLAATQVQVVVRGLENLDPTRHYVFMANHRSNADIVAIAWALWDFQLRWVAKKELLRVPVFGWGLKAMKNIIIDRSDREGAIESYQRARARMERGISVMVFPEGTRGQAEELLPFKKGGFVLALETETPIVPMAVHGTAAVLARKGWKIEKGVVEVTIGRPIATAGRAAEERDRLVEEVREAIVALVRAEPPRSGRAVGEA